MWWNAVIMYPHCRPHFLQHDPQQRHVPQYFSIICEALGCLAWLFPTRWGNVWHIVMWPCENWSISVWIELSWNDVGHCNLQILLHWSVYFIYCLPYILYKHISLQFADGEGVQHSYSVDCLIRNLTSVIHAVPPAMLTAVFGNVEHCMSPGVGETILSSSLTNLHNCQIVDWSVFIALVCNY